jgi:TonB family protein
VNLLLRSSFWLTLALGLVLLLRPLLRRAYGAELSYAAWSLVPLVLLVVCLPPLPYAGWTATQTWTPMQQVFAAADAERDGPSYWHTLLLTFWLLGVLVFAGLQWRAQRRYLARLLPLRRQGDHLRSDSPYAEPALLGGCSPQLLLPGNFEDRYTPAQQALVRLHESVHARRHDPLINLLAVGLVALFWFHPLAHLGCRLLRRDQELACDAAVLRAHPESRRAYAEALLITQIDRPGLPVGCTWQSSHPLKQRLKMLKKPTPGKARFRLGLLTLGLLATPLVLSAWTAEIPTGQPADGLDWQPRLANLAGQMPPQYPSAALKEKQTGLVLVEVKVNRDGSVSDAAIRRAQPPEVFDQAALEYAWRMRFEPAPTGSHGAQATVEVPIKFDLAPEKNPAEG